MTDKAPSSIILNSRKPDPKGPGSFNFPKDYSFHFDTGVKIKEEQLRVMHLVLINEQYTANIFILNANQAEAKLLDSIPDLRIAPKTRP